MELGGSFLFQEKGGDAMASQCQSVFGHCMFLDLLPAFSGGPKTSEKSLKVFFGAISTFVFVVECIQTK